MKKIITVWRENPMKHLFNLLSCRSIVSFYINTFKASQLELNLKTRSVSCLNSRKHKYKKKLVSPNEELENEKQSVKVCSFEYIKDAIIWKEPKFWHNKQGQKNEISLLPSHFEIVLILKEYLIFESILPIAECVEYDTDVNYLLLNIALYAYTPNTQYLLNCQRICGGRYEGNYFLHPKLLLKFVVFSQKEQKKENVCVCVLTLSGCFVLRHSHVMESFNHSRSFSKAIIVSSSTTNERLYLHMLQYANHWRSNVGQFFIPSKGDEMWLGLAHRDVYVENTCLARSKRTIFYYGARESGINCQERNPFSFPSLFTFFIFIYLFVYLFICLFGH
ncbi:hypothetical protein RFI_10505 [Reticulomyxa filosa]|uniref:Uncharacterized protein n=1 Tax=Reticulomyxa filosa TaxID=46433 RepID=X6NKV6_RETFI|nr:hypothetical protein RFI_10505 [Reticulomyxa filosa]|eukprot:ETO26631.1 hypothetical protein RFI_10505 [Reticulomyxa filosa]